LIELQFGVHRSDWSVVTQTLDPSYLPVSTFTPNSGIPVGPDYTQFAGSILDQKATSLGLVPVSSSTVQPVSVALFDEQALETFSRKYLAGSGGGFRTVTVDAIGRTLKLDSIRSAEYTLQRSRYGAVSKADRANLDTATDPLIPVSVVIVPATAPNGLAEAARKQWIDSAKAALGSGLITKYGLVNFRLAGFTLNGLANKSQAVAMSWDPTISRMGRVVDQKIVNDMWAAAYRMNVDFLHAYNFKGQGIVLADWEEGMPTFQDQMGIDQYRLTATDFGVCRTIIPSSNCTYYGTNLDAASGTCTVEEIAPKSSCVGSSKSWVLPSDAGVCVDATGKLYMGNMQSTCTQPNTWTPGSIDNQHASYMCAAMKNSRTNTVNPNFPENTQFGGTGFAPQGTLLLGNFASFQGASFQSGISEKQAALSWLADNSANIVNQSWHLGSSDAIYNDEGNTPTWFDALTDLFVWSYHITMTQAAGDAGYLATVVHKGYNTIVVGEDNRDSYQMVTAISNSKNSTTGELPHLTAGVNACGLGISGLWCSSDQSKFPSGVSIFDYSATGVPVVTPRGATSLASAMVAGIAGAVESINPTRLKNAPWAVRAILMASADNIEGQWWNPDPSDDQKDGAGRVNGANAYVAASEPYRGTGLAAESGFYSGTISQSTPFSYTISIIPRQTGNLRIGLSWLAQVDQSGNENLADLDLSLTGPAPDGTTKTWTSASMVNPVEMIHAQVIAGQTYTLVVTTDGTATYDVPFGLAWINR
jgi:hypothetical protein